MGVKAERLALAAVVRGEGVLEELERRSVVHRGVAVGSIAAASVNIISSQKVKKTAYSQGSIKCGPSTPRLSNWAYIGSGSLVEGDPAAAAAPPMAWEGEGVRLGGRCERGRGVGEEGEPEDVMPGLLGGVVNC